MSTPTTAKETEASAGIAPAVTLASGRVVALRAPTAGELRGIKLLDVLQLDAGAHALLLPRISDLSAMEFYQLGPADLMALMSEAVAFFAPATAPAFPPASKTPGN